MFLTPLSSLCGSISTWKHVSFSLVTKLTNDSFILKRSGKTVKILEKTQEGAVVKARVEMTDEELQPYFEKAYKKTQKNIELPGFRKGKVPLSMIIKRYGPAVRAEALEDIITEVYPKIVDETGEKPIAPGDVEEPDYQDGEYLRFTAIMEIKPEFELVDWKALEVKQEVAEITDDDINTHLEYMRKDKAIVSEAQDDQGADGVDRLTVNLQQLDENGVEVIGKSFKDITFEFGTDYLGPNTDEQLKGIKKDEVRKVMTERHIHPEEGEHVDEKYGWEVTPTKIERSSCLSWTMISPHRSMKAMRPWTTCAQRFAKTSKPMPSIM